METKNERWKRIDEFRDGGKSVCGCGHRGDGPNSQHEDVTEFAPGHGACKECPEGRCPKFQWDHWAADDKRMQRREWEIEGVSVSDDYGRGMRWFVRHHGVVVEAFSSRAQARAFVRRK